MTTLMERSLNAEARAVEEGHHAWLNGDRRTFTIHSDGTDLRYTVSVTAHTTGDVAFTCDHPVVRGWAGPLQSDGLGALCCKHTALVARRLEREGWLVWDEGQWRLSAKALGAVQTYAKTLADPFEGL